MENQVICSNLHKDGDARAQVICPRCGPLCSQCVYACTRKLCSAAMLDPVKPKPSKREGMFNLLEKIDKTVQTEGISIKEAVTSVLKNLHSEDVTE